MYDIEDRIWKGRKWKDGWRQYLCIAHNRLEIERKRNEYEKETNKNESDKEDISLNLMVKEREEDDSQVDLP